MEIKKLFLVVADISGYTRFIKMHRSSLVHAEMIVIDLLESVINQSDHPLTLHEVLGDAVTFYAVSDDHGGAAHAIYRQVQQFMEAFRKREGELVSECKLCECDACNNIGQLKLKVILHFGEAVFSKIKNLTKIAGEDVITLHRLLKNSITANEYILLTDSFAGLLEDSITSGLESRIEKEKDLGKIRIFVEYPEGEDAIVPARLPFLRKLKQKIRLESYSVLRLVMPAKKRFRNLPK